MDRRISNIIKEWKTEAKVDSVILVSAFPTSRDTLIICTDSPGRLIGKGGETYKKYKAKIKEVAPRVENVRFIETDSWYIK